MQRLRRRYADELALLPPGAPGRAHMVQAFEALTERGDAIGDALRVGAKGTVDKAGKRQAIVRADVWAESDGEEPRRCAIAQATIVPVG